MLELDELGVRILPETAAVGGDSRWNMGMCSTGGGADGWGGPFCVGSDSICIAAMALVGIL